MPSKNAIKTYASGQYYHLYNRGANKEVIFHERPDYLYFLYLFKRHLSKHPLLDKAQRPYRHLYGKVELLAYCLMSNHFHLLVYNVEKTGIESLMHSVITAYSMYYNKKYEHSGRLFQGVYKASMITADQYLQHVARYIHRNPKNYERYAYSSYQVTVNQYQVDWLSNRLINEIFDGSIKEYESFVADYEDFKESWSEVKNSIADR